MLVLTRKLRETIRIGDEITLTVLRVKGNTVRIGIEAPRSVRVVRGELEFKLDEQASDSEPPVEKDRAAEGAVEGEEPEIHSGRVMELPVTPNRLKAGCYVL